MLRVHAGHGHGQRSSRHLLPPQVVFFVVGVLPLPRLPEELLKKLLESRQCHRAFNSLPNHCHAEQAARSATEVPACSEGICFSSGPTSNPPASPHPSARSTAA